MQFWQRGASQKTEQPEPLTGQPGNEAPPQATPGGDASGPHGAGDGRGALPVSAVLVTDDRGVVSLCTPASAAFFGTADLVGGALAELLTPAGAESPSLQELMARARALGSASAEMHLAGGHSSAPLRATVTPLVSAPRHPQSYHWSLEQPAAPQVEGGSLVQALLEAMPHPVYLKGADGSYCDCNERFTTLLELTRDQILGRLPSQLDSPHNDLVQALSKAHPSADPRCPGLVLPVRSAAGATCTLFFIEAPLIDDRGVCHGKVGIIPDLTEQTLAKDEQQLQATMLEDEIAKHQQVAEALRQREKMLSLVINAVPQNIFWKDTNLVYAGCNDAFARAAGLPSPDAVVGKTDYDLPWSPEEAEAYRRDDREVMRLDRAKYHLTETQLQADGSLLTVDTTKIPLHGDGGCVVGVLGVYEDISQRTEVARRLKESEERLSVIFEASQVGIVLVNPDGRISFANRRMAEMFGLPLEELLGTPYVSWLHPSEEGEGSSLAARLIAGQVNSVAVERHYRRRDGSDFWGYLSGRRLETSDGSLMALVGCIADVTELKVSQSALQREKERLAVTLRSIGDGVITVDTAGKVVLINRMAEELCGYRQEEAAGLPLDQVFRVVEERSRIPKENAIARALTTGEVVEQSGLGVLVARDGTERIIVSKTAPILDHNQAIPGVVLVFSDITERRGIEEELFKARKLESLGILAGGIAHDFNNLLTGIMGNISLSRATLPDEHQAAVFLDRARKGAEQSKALTLQLLTFSKGGAPVKKLTSISQVLTDSATFALRGSNVRCDFDIAPDLWSAEIDTGQMSQVISNLVINADQAMPEGGTILIRAENVLPLDEEDSQHRIRITFKDTGVGIGADDLSRIYDPYFSTKATGNGLGLATVYAIIKNHDGEIKVFSRRGHGTTFAITLPAQDGPPPEPPLEIPQAPLAPASDGGRILLMDDEDAIREMAKAALTMFGYHAVVVSDGEELLEVYQRELAAGHRFAAVIMDLTIPGGMGGKDAVKKLLELDPDAVAVASSGYSEDLVMAKYREFGFAGVVSKPYSLNDLEATLKEIIARTKGDGA